MNAGEILIYQNSEGDIKLDVRLEEDTVWLTQDQMAALFGKARSTITEHIQNVFKEGELNDEVVCRNFRLTTQHGAIEGKTQEISVKHYNLDVIISVGYRVKSQQGTQFRIWATQRLREHNLKGISLINPLSYFRYLSIKDQHFASLLTIFSENMLANPKNYHRFEPNNTCHASHLNSAPGQVFAFYRLLVFNALNPEAYVL